MRALHYKTLIRYFTEFFFYTNIFGFWPDSRKLNVGVALKINMFIQVWKQKWWIYPTKSDRAFIAKPSGLIWVCIFGAIWVFAPAEHKSSLSCLRRPNETLTLQISQIPMRIEILFTLYEITLKFHYSFYSYEPLYGIDYNAAGRQLL